MKNIKTFEGFIDFANKIINRNTDDKIGEDILKHIQGLDKIDKKIVNSSTGSFFTTTYKGVNYIFNYNDSICRVRDIDIEVHTTSSFKNLQKKKKERTISLDDKKLEISNRLFNKILDACENKSQLN